MPLDSDWIHNLSFHHVLLVLDKDEEIDCSNPIRDENPIETFEGQFEWKNEYSLILLYQHWLIFPSLFVLDEGEESINNAYPKPIRHEKPIEASKSQFAEWKNDYNVYRKRKKDSWQ